MIGSPSCKLNFLVKLLQVKNVPGASNLSRLTATDVVSIEEEEITVIISSL